MPGGQGKKPSKNSPTTWTKKDRRLTGNGGAKPGPKKKK